MTVLAALTAWFHSLAALTRLQAGRSAAAAEPWSLLNNYLVRAQRRLLALFAAWQAGTLAPPRPRPPRPRSQAANPAPRPPRRRAWLVSQAGHHAAAHASQLQHMLAQPEMRRFVAEVPRAGRILRPLAHLLGLPAPPRPPRPPRPRKPRAPPVDLPDNVRAAARAWNKASKSLLFLKKKKQKDFYPLPTSTPGPSG